MTTFDLIFKCAVIALAIMLALRIMVFIVGFIMHIKVERMLQINDNNTGDEIKIPLKKCPFCGKNVAEIYETQDDNGEKLYSLVCDINNKGCGCSTGRYDTPIDAVTAWNTRSYMEEYEDDE